MRGELVRRALVGPPLLGAAGSGRRRALWLGAALVGIALLGRRRAP